MSLLSTKRGSDDFICSLQNIVRYLYRSLQCIWSLVLLSLSTKRGSDERESPFVDSSVTSGCAYIDLPTPLRVHTLNYLGETIEEFRTLTVLSKKFNEDCKRPGIEWNIIQTIELSPLEHYGGHTVNLFRNLRDKNRLLQRYRLMIVKKAH